MGPHRPWQSRSQSIVFEGHQCDYWITFEGFFSRVSTGQSVVAVWKMEIPEVHRYSNLALWAILSSQTVDTLISSRFYHGTAPSLQGTAPGIPEINAGFPTSNHQIHSGISQPPLFLGEHIPNYTPIISYISNLFWTIINYWYFGVYFGGFHKGSTPLDGLFHGKSLAKMYENWGYPYDSGNLRIPSGNWRVCELENGPVEIVDVPNLKMVIFHS